MSEQSPTDAIEALRLTSAAADGEQEGDPPSVHTSWTRLNLALTVTLPRGVARAKAARRRIERVR
jgi:hypothetical protein